MDSRIQELIEFLERQKANPQVDLEEALEQTVDTLKRALPHYTWVGIYLVEGDELVLGPFQGEPTVHTRIPIGQGICGWA
ncbi:MAG: GAF domain-containing protein, partial [Anaerolineae bacterium]